MLQAYQAQLLSAQRNPVNRVDLFAHICPGILSKLCAAGGEGFRDFEHCRLFAAKALLLSYHEQWSTARETALRAIMHEVRDPGPQSDVGGKRRL